MGNTDSTALLGDTLRALEERDAPEATVTRVVAGDSLLIAEFETTAGDRLAGVVHSPTDGYREVTGESARTLIERVLTDDPGVDDRALAVAALNALSAPFLDWGSGDPMEALDPSVSRIGMVGMFTPAFHKFDAVDIRVIERFPEDISPPTDLPESVSVSVFGPDEAEMAFEDTAVIFVTGSTLIYGGLERYLEAAPSNATVVLIGSSASFVPEAIFDAGVAVQAGAAVTDIDLVADRIAGRTTVPKLHGTGLEKGVLVNEASRPLSGFAPAFGSEERE